MKGGDQETVIILAKKVIKYFIVANIYIYKLFAYSGHNIITKIKLHATETIGFTYCAVSGFANKIIFKVVLTSLIFIRVYSFLCNQVFIAIYR